MTRTPTNANLDKDSNKSLKKTPTSKNVKENEKEKTLEKSKKI
jgi:hypothetical protein